MNLYREHQKQKVTVRCVLRETKNVFNHHHHHQFNTHECSMNNKIHEKAHTIIQKEIQKDG